ncbi:30S ribosomal protein S27ae [Candidatus Pacearchaeota archaeon]|nr:30S ribosomal protein S27ae [Candidatus Pacearchaeota archaeon]
MAKKGVKKGKKPHKNKPTSKKYSKYKIEGDKVMREKFCPRCGPGVFLMKAKDRVYCGRCHYSEFQSKEEKDQLLKSSKPSA